MKKRFKKEDLKKIRKATGFSKIGGFVIDYTKVWNAVRPNIRLFPWVATAAKENFERYERNNS